MQASCFFIGYCYLYRQPGHMTKVVALVASIAAFHKHGCNTWLLIPRHSLEMMCTAHLTGAAAG